MSARNLSVVFLTLPAATPVERAFWDEMVRSRRLTRKLIQVPHKVTLEMPLDCLTPTAARLLGLHLNAVRRENQRRTRDGRELGVRKNAAETQKSETGPDAAANIADWLSPELKNQSGPDAFVYQSWRGKPVPNPKGFAKPEALRKNPKIGETTDYFGELWDIRQSRPTRHGFDLLYGSRAAERGLHAGVPRLIPTRELRDFWHTNRTKLHGLIYDLPAGRTTLKRVRQRFGFNFHEDLAEFWTDRIDDLKSLTTRQFAAKHGVAQGTVNDKRQAIFGRRARPEGWWRRSKCLEILFSTLTLGQAGKKLGISTSQVHRLRRRANAEFKAAA